MSFVIEQFTFMYSRVASAVAIGGNFRKGKVGVLLKLCCTHLLNITLLNLCVCIRNMQEGLHCISLPSQEFRNPFVGSGG